MVQDKRNIKVNTKKLVIIGASIGQLPLVARAKEMGLHTICIAWDRGAVCKEICDEFYPISIFEVDDIVEKCRDLKVDGVVTTASEETALVCSKVSTALGLNGVSPETLEMIQDKSTLRELTTGIIGLSKPKVWSINEKNNISYPCVVKPTKGSAKKGVSYCASADELDSAISYAKDASREDIIIEEYITGDEYSVESLSFHGKHQIIQITKKITTGYPHFVELEHHQPAVLSPDIKENVGKVIEDILVVVGYENGAAHIEIKINSNGIYLIEVNPRGGGDRISDTLVGLSTDFDYLGAMIEVGLDQYSYRPSHNTNYSGILFLSAQSERLMKYFDDSPYEWLVERKITDLSEKRLTEATGNYDRNGYIIYQSTTPIEL